MKAKTIEILETEIVGMQRRPWKVALRMFGWVMVWLTISAGAILTGAALWIRRTFGDISIDQMLLNLPGAGGVETTAAEMGYISSFVAQAIILPVAIVLVALGLWLLTLGILRLRRRRVTQTGLAQLGRKWAPASFSMVAVISGVVIFAQTTGLSQYLQSFTSNLTMSQYYVAPKLNNVSESVSNRASGINRPLNLVTIYLESTDDLFTDRELFGEDLLAPLTDVTRGWESIPDLRMYDGGGWTMAGLVGTQCGLPLRGAGLGENDINSNNIGSETSTYLPGATCLGDVLANAGYTNVFLGGADLEFASKGDFFESHGYSIVKGLKEWEREVVISDEDLGIWGVSDRELMNQAEREFKRLYETGKPFNLTLLTLDFHEPPHRFSFCPEVSEQVLDSVLLCSMKQVADFVTFLEASGYLEDTVVVIMADHPKMLAEGGAYRSELEALTLDERTLFNRIWMPEIPAIIQTDIDQLSIYATILDMLSLGQEHRVAGLGASVFDAQSAAEKFKLTPAEYREVINSRSLDLYEELWANSHSTEVVAQRMTQ